MKPTRPMFALLINMFGFPKWFLTTDAAFCIESTDRTSKWMAIASPFSDNIWSATAFAFVISISVTAIIAPSLDNNKANSLPLPSPAPVINIIYFLMILALLYNKHQIYIKISSKSSSYYFFLSR